MGREILSEESYWSARRSFGVTSDVHVTRASEQKARDTGKLSPLVDPSNDPIRRSLMRFDPVKLANGKKAWMVTVGLPVPVETHVDTTGSMGDNVDISMKNLPSTCGLLQQVLPGCDVQYAVGIFGDVIDDFIFQRGQFEMTSEKLVEALINMVPERGGGDIPEDPHYGIFGAAYLTSTYINRIGLKGYHFTVSDAPYHQCFQMSQLKRVFGDDVLDRVRENGFADFSENDIACLTVRDVVQDLLERTHAFFIGVDGYGKRGVSDAWFEAYGRARVIAISSTKYLPQAQAAIVGLTEGTLDLQTVSDFLTENGMPQQQASDLVQQLRDIPLGAQAKLREQLEHALPNPGDIYLSKGDLWPALDVETMVREKVTQNPDQEEGPNWL